MKMSHLEEFIEIARAQSISEAAENLYLTHQALSKHLLDIEKEIGCPLVTRSTPLQLTLAGEAFLQSSAAITAEYQRMMQTIERLKAETPRRVRILTYDHILFPDILAATIRNLRAKHPNISVEFRKETRISSEEALLEDKIDLGWYVYFSEEEDFTVPDDEQFSFTSLNTPRDILRFGVSNEHPLAHRKEGTVTLEELSSYPIAVPTCNSKSMLSTATEQLFIRYGLTPRLLLVSASNLDEFHMKVSPLGIYPMPEFYDRFMKVPNIFTDSITIIEPADATFFASSYCMTRKDTENKALQPFLDELVATLEGR